MAACVLFAFPKASQRIPVFDTTPTVVSYGTAALRSMAASDLFSAVGVVIWFHRGGWKRREV